ncbi:MAG: dihydropteroate synthase [Bacteroidetes bacterium]|nr:dihydropteroate synthase [Bacteroidota bacterium]
MGIVNITPDSFSDGGRYLMADAAIEHGLKLLSEGADWLDLGAESTRPGAAPVPESLESDRLLPVIEGILKHRPDAVLSIDTTKSAVAARCLEQGAAVINDISGGTFDPGMIQVVARSGAGYIVMHIQGTPKTMQANPVYQDVVAEVAGFLNTQCRLALEAGVPAVFRDPGFGFGKTLEHNYQLLKNLPRLCHSGQPLVVGLSRKSMIGLVTGKPAGERVIGSKILEFQACLGGARLLRVHDVAETVDMLKLLSFMEKVS